MLEFWRACELFTPHEIPKLDPGHARQPVFPLDVGPALPWQNGHPLRGRRVKPNLTWRHIVYGGLFSLQNGRDQLRKVFGPDPDIPDPPPPGTGALFALAVTDEGRPLLNSLQVSSSAWALGRTEDPGPDKDDWLFDYDEDDRDIRERLEALIAPRADDERAVELARKGVRVGRALHGENLENLVALATKLLRVGDILHPAGMRVRCVQIARKREHAAGDAADPLGSFIVGDLARVSNAIRHGWYGSALGEYLSTDAIERIDVRRTPHVVAHLVAPDRIPYGRWPAEPDRSQTLSQQFAVDAIMDQLAGVGGLFAVNGPPGTGKTTLLRELIAANVVERAVRLSRLPKTSGAFGQEYRWKIWSAAEGREYVRRVTGWAEQLTGFEMVVASANNGAVENVTHEIPDRGAIGEPWRQGADYFADIATAVLERPAWGLIAARLGRRDHRTEFVRRAWFGIDDKPGLLQRLRDCENEDVDWQAAVARFSRCHERVLRLQQERSLAYRVVELKYAVEESDRLTDKARRDLSRARELVESAARAVESCEVRQREHQRLRHTTEAGEWRATADCLADELSEAARKLHRAHQQVIAVQRHLAATYREDVEIRRELDQARSRLGRRPDLLALYQGALDQDELAAPWTDREWNTARTELFFEALRLHQAFLKAESARIRASLQGAIDILLGESLVNASEEAIRAAWQTLFFVVPVVSTTFASFGSMFSHITEESLGWVILDEAGQAAPQQAAGAIWRGRRVIALGDPFQLEPVVPLSIAAQQALRRTFGVEEERWLPGRTSVQHLADQRTAYGTYLPDDEDQVWVGAPLRVHRRCDEPMFSISNAIAYGGLMVYGKPPAPAYGMPPSKWIDVPTLTSKGHWVPEEGAAAEKVLRYLVDQGGVSVEDILVLTPFRDVVRELWLILRPLRGLRYGTVHTAQGREADVVIVVLGGDPRRPGAKRWAASSPNLLNVAVSRARRRLYVIGDRAGWSQHRHFNTLSQHLGGPQPPHG
ncbi:DEAD/DEAH box helicase [Microbispora rosea]|uniref:DEAD/DEAH box helicase n=1 Tax=Microbispora rosea TaxID=58117 RepID=UPI0037BCFA06